MQAQDEPLDEVDFDLAATRPALLLGLPYTLAASLLLVGMYFVMFWGDGHDWVKDLREQAIGLAALGAVWSAAKIMLRQDYHGWDIFVAWLMLDARCLDTAEWGGAHLSSFPLRSIYRTGCDHAA